MPNKEALEETRDRLKQLSNKQLLDIAMFSDMLRGEDLDLLDAELTARELEMGNAYDPDRG